MDSSDDAAYSASAWKSTWCSSPKLMPPGLLSPATMMLVAWPSTLRTEAR